MKPPEDVERDLVRQWIRKAAKSSLSIVSRPQLLQLLAPDIRTLANRIP
ncbi:MAG: hypothetical protein ABSF98_05410 [Bryobacteraceae bacterium]|jgi:hypothetical protein